MNKKLIAVLLVLAIVVTGCTSGPKVTSENKTEVTKEESKEKYHYAETNVLGEGEKIVKASSSDDELVYIKESPGNKGEYLVTAINKKDEKREMKVMLEGTPSSLYMTKANLYIMVASQRGTELVTFNSKGEKEKTLTISTTQDDSESEGEEMFYGSQTILYADQERLIVSDYNSILSYDLSSGEKKSLLDETFAYTSVKNGQLYGLLNGQKSEMVIYDLTTNREVNRLVLPKGIYLTTLIPKENGFVGIDYENNIYAFDQTMKMVSKASLSDVGPKRFMKNTMVNDVFYWNNSIYYTIMFDESIIDMTSGDSAIEFNGATLLAMERKEGENPRNAGLKEVIIYSHKTDYMLSLYAKEFMGKNENVKITIKTFDDLSKADYVKKMNTDLIAGESIDLVNLNDVPADKLVKKNFFEDLSKHLSKENRDSFYPSVLDGIKYNNAVYGLPISFSTQGIYLNKAIMNDAARAYEKLPTIQNFNAMLDSYKNSDVKVFRKLENEEIIKLLLDNNLQGLVDQKATAPVSKERLDQFLDTLKSIQDHHMDKEMGRDEYIYYGTKDKVLGEVSNYVEQFSLGYVKALLAKDYVLVPYPSIDGGGYSGVGMVYGIPAASKSKDEAIDFLKFLSTNEKVQDSLSFMGLTSVNKGSLDRYIAKMNKESEGTQVMMMGMPEQTKYGEKVINMSESTNADYELLSNAFSKTNNIEVYNSNVKQLIVTEIVNHLKVGSTRDELLGTLNNKLFLYYNE